MILHFLIEQKRNHCSKDSQGKTSKKDGKKNKGRKNRKPEDKKDRRKMALDSPLKTFVRQALLLPPDARLRFTMKETRRKSEDKVWGIRDAMTKTNLMFTAWDGFSNRTELFTSEKNVIDINLPYCSNGVSNTYTISFY